MIPLDIWNLYMLVLRDGYENSNSIMLPAIEEFRAKHGISREAQISPSQLIVKQNFTHFCTPDIINMGGVVIYLDFYNTKIDKMAKKHQSDWVNTLIFDKEMTIYDQNGQLTVCEPENRARQFLNRFYVH